MSGGDSETIGNSDTIIAHFITEYRLTIDATLTAAQRDMSHLMLLREVGESDRLAQRGPFAGAAQLHSHRSRCQKAEIVAQRHRRSEFSPIRDLDPQRFRPIAARDPACRTPPQSYEHLGRSNSASTDRYLQLRSDDTPRRLHRRFLELAPPRLWSPPPTRRYHLPPHIDGTQAVVSRRVPQPTLEQADIMDALELAFATLLVDDGDPLGIRKEDADTDESFSTCGPR